MADRPITLLLIAVAAVFISSGSAAEAKLDPEAWKEITTRFEKVFSEPGDPLSKSQVLTKILGDDSARAWTLMAEGFLREVELWKKVHGAEQAAVDAHAVLLADAVRGYAHGVYEKVQKIQNGMPGLEEASTKEDAALSAVIRVVSLGPEALRKKILGRKKSADGWPYRAAAAKVALNTMQEKGSAAYLEKAITADPDPRVRLGTLEAFAATGEDVKAQIIGRLQDTDWRVQMLAAQLIERRRIREGVRHLINALPKSRLRVAHVIAKVLKSFAQLDIGIEAKAWAAWWADHGEEFGGGKVSIGKPRKHAAVHVFGIPLESDRILFLLDISKSSRRPAVDPRPRSDGQPPYDGPIIDLGKHEIAKAVSELPDWWRFNVSCYNQGVLFWQKKMLKANDKNREEAIQWLRALKAHGCGYVDGGLKMAFRAAGMLSVAERAPPPAFDTIVLVSDGGATDNVLPLANFIKPKVIHDHVTTWNRNRQVVIHCVCLEYTDYMQKLAKDNGGTYLGPGR